MRAFEVPSRIHGPDAYSLLWLVLGCCLLVIAVLIVVIRIWLSRRHARKLVAELKPAGIEPLRNDYLARLAVVSDQWHEGSLTDRQALQQSSELVRGFVGIVTDTDTDTMTLTEMYEAAQLSPKLGVAVDLIANNYQARFTADELSEVSVTLKEMSEMVTQWR